MIIKPIVENKDIQQIGQVEADTWGMQLTETVPEHVLTAVARDGGVLLGAYQDDQLIGFTLGWLGLTDPTSQEPAAAKLKLVSHMTGVLEAYRDQRVGFQLKLAQREWALSRGLELITWTYDPLESRNAYFNIHLLGCTCRTYLREYYGNLRDDLNRGIPADRFRVDWWIKNLPVERRLRAQENPHSSSEPIAELENLGVRVINPASRDQEKLPQPFSREVRFTASRILVEIPPDTQAIRKTNQNLAAAWRIHTREIFEMAFKRGYQVNDFIYQRDSLHFSCYLLEQGAYEN